MEWIPHGLGRLVLMPVVALAVGLAAAPAQATADDRSDARATATRASEAVTPARVVGKRARVLRVAVAPRARSSERARPRVVGGRTRVILRGARLRRAARVELRVGTRLVRTLGRRGATTRAVAWLDTHGLRNGRHVLRVIVVRRGGKRSVTRQRIVVRNAASVRQPLRRDRPPRPGAMRGESDLIGGVLYARPDPPSLLFPPAPSAAPSPPAPAPVRPAAAPPVPVPAPAPAPPPVPTPPAAPVPAPVATPPPLTPTPPPAPAVPPAGDAEAAIPGELFRGDFETGDLSQYRDPAHHSGPQRVATDRIRVVTDPVTQGRYAARFEVRSGDRYGSSSGERAELLYWSAEREGDERTYSWSTKFDPTYPYDTANGWQIFTQFHMNNGFTQPPLQFYATGNRIGMKTVRLRADGSSYPSVSHWTTDMSRGHWHHFRLHVRWSADPSTGFVELWHNGVRVVDRTAVATLQPGGEWVTYIKQGLYRSDRITPTAIVYHDGLVISRR